MTDTMFNPTAPHAQFFEVPVIQVEAEETPGVIEHSTLGPDVEYGDFEFEVTIGRVKPMTWLEQK